MYIKYLRKGPILLRQALDKGEETRRRRRSMATFASAADFVFPRRSKCKAAASARALLKWTYLEMPIIVTIQITDLNQINKPPAGRQQINWLGWTDQKSFWRQEHSGFTHSATSPTTGHQICKVSSRNQQHTSCIGFQWHLQAIEPHNIQFSCY